MTSWRSKKMLIPALLGASTLVLTACGNDGSGGETASAQPENTATTTVTETSADDTGTDTASADEALSAADVVEAALEEVPGDAVGLSMDREDGDAEVTVLREDGTGAEVEVDLANGSILQVREESLDNDEQPAPTVSIVEAMDTALGEVDGTVDDADLGTNFGDRVWEITVVDTDNREQEVKIDAETGDVIGVERD